MAKKQLHHRKVASSIIVGAISLSVALFFFIPYITEKYTIKSLIAQTKNSVKQIKLTRAYYVDAVVDDVKKYAPNLVFHYDHQGINGRIPLPTTMIHDLSKIFSENTGLRYNLYSEYPFRNRLDRKLTPFQKEAIRFTKENPEGVYVKRDVIDGKEVLRVATTDFMTDESCVTCHNSHPDRTWHSRKWKLGDKRGVLEVITPIDDELADHAVMRNYILLIIFLVFGSVLIYLSKNILNREKELLNATDELESEVDDKKKELQTFHALMDDHIISSKTDTKGVITYVSKAFIEISGYSQEELIGRPHSIVRHPDMPKEIFRDLWDTITSGKTWSGEIQNLTKEGSTYWVSAVICPDFGTKGAIVGYSAIRHNITSEKQAKYLANHDYLTNLPNRSHFEKVLMHAIGLAHRDNGKLAVLFIDCDNFKDINDTYGHSVGDKLLKAVAEKIKEVLGEGDSIARLGGDEFVVLLEGFDDPLVIMQAVTDILETIKEPIAIGSFTVRVTISIGIALYPNDGATARELMKNADNAMYHIKEKGKGSYKFYTKSISESIQRRLDIELALRNAIDYDGFRLVYQPKINLQTREVIGCEALIRLKESFGNYMPDEFIPIAEANHKILEIGDWVLRESLKTFRHWLDTGIDAGTVSINVSTVQLHQKRFAHKVLETIEEVGLSPNQLELEITEHSIMDSNMKSIAALKRLKMAGVAISIDDFGTGYSSMVYLKKLPINTIKIDRAFITDLVSDKEDVEIIKAIVTLSNSLGYSVLAEGIEEESQESILLENACCLGQGYLYSRPLDPDDFVEFFQQNRS